MGLQQNLNNIQTNLLQAKTAIAQSISNKGVECSATDKLSTFASKIDSITTGSTGGTGNKIMLTNGTKFARSTAFDPELYDVSNVTDMSNMFNDCRRLTSLDLSNWKVSNVTNMSNMFNYCTELSDFKLSDLGHNENCTELDLTPCSALTKDSVLYLINNAFDRATAGYTTQHTIALAPETKALLTEEEIAIATNKGFTVV